MLKAIGASEEQAKTAGDRPWFRDEETGEWFTKESKKAAKDREAIAAIIDCPWKRNSETGEWI